MSDAQEPQGPPPLVGRCTRGLLLLWSLTVFVVFFAKARLPGPALSHSLRRAVELLLR